MLHVGTVMPGTLKEVLEQKAQMNKRDKECVTKPQTPRARGLQCSGKRGRIGQYEGVLCYTVGGTLRTFSAVP